MWQLIINGPGYFDTTYDLPDGATFLGRADENDIVLSGDLVSRKHARILADGDALTIEDLGSRNGCRLNGQILQGVMEIRPGDTINVGENTLSIRQPSKVENALTEMVRTASGGIRHFGEGTDIDGAVVIARNVRDSVVLRVLDNVSPFDNPFGADSPAPPFTAEAGAAGEPLAYASLVLLFKVAESLSRASTLQQFLDETTGRVLERVKATTAVVLLRHQGGALVPAAVRHRGKLSEGEVPVSDAIVSAALAKGAALAVSDVRDDARFAGRESVLIYGVDQVLCIPIGDDQPFAGVLYLNKGAGDQQELEQLLDVCSAVCHLIATGISKFNSDDTGRKEDKLRRALERFHPPEIAARRLAELSRSGSGPVERLEQRHVSALAVDIAGFAAQAQKGDPDVVLEILNEFYRRIAGIVFSFEGTMDKFLGDSALAVFGAPYSRGDDALRAVRAALALRADWSAAMRRRPPQWRTELRLAIHTGPALAGLAGADSRLDYAVLGEPVGFSTWLCGTAQAGQVLITAKTLAGVGARFDVTPLGDRPLRNPKERIAVFEVLEEDVPASTNPGLG